MKPALFQFSAPFVSFVIFVVNQNFFIERERLGKPMQKRRVIRIALIVLALFLPLQTAHAAAAPTKVTIHVPSKSLSIMPYYFGKDKGFFAAEQIEPQLIMMAPPTAIAAMAAGELDFSSTTGAATSAIMRGLPLRRVFYVQQDPVHVLLAQPEIKSVQELVGKTVGVNALTDATGMSTNAILRAHGIDAGKTTLLALQVTDNMIKVPHEQKGSRSHTAAALCRRARSQGLCQNRRSANLCAVELHRLG